MSGGNWKAMFEALANEHRRRLLVALLEHDSLYTEMDVSEDSPVRDEELEFLQIEFYHNHLPKLEAAGFIEWNRETHEVSTGPNFDEIRPLLEVIEKHRDELPDGLV